MSLNLERLLQNKTGFVSRPFHQRDRHGYDVITVVAKQSWRIADDGSAERLNPQRGIRPTAEHYNKDGDSSVRYPADRVPEKPGTDVIMLASVYPPAGDAVTSHDIRLRVHSNNGTIEKTVRAFGERQFVRDGDKLIPSEAMPLVPFALTYEMAAGGLDQQVMDAVRAGNMSREELAPLKDRIYDEVNPYGKGCAADLNRLVGTPAYQLELVGGSAPAGFAPVESHWSARKHFAGTRDDHYFRRRHPLAPKDLDPRHYCASHPDLWSEVPLRGDERVEINGAVPEQIFTFALPYSAPLFRARVAGKEVMLDTHLDTFLIDLQDTQLRVVELGWRASVRLPKKSERLEWIRINNATGANETNENPS